MNQQRTLNAEFFNMLDEARSTATRIGNGLRNHQGVRTFDDIDIAEIALKGPKFLCTARNMGRKSFNIVAETLESMGLIKSAKTWRQDWTEKVNPDLYCDCGKLRLSNNVINLIESKLERAVFEIKEELSLMK